MASQLGRLNPGRVLEGRQLLGDVCLRATEGHHQVADAGRSVLQPLHDGQAFGVGKRAEDRSFRSERRGTPALAVILGICRFLHLPER